MKAPLTRLARGIRGSLTSQDQPSTSAAPGVGALILPLVGMYAGQYLARTVKDAPYWGLAIIAVSLAVLLLRLRPPRTAELCDWLLMALGLLTMLPLALNPGGWKTWTGTTSLLGVWLLAILFVVVGVSHLKPQAVRLRMENVSRLQRADWLILVALFVGALLLRVPAIETVPLGVDPDEGSLAQLTWDATTGAAKDPFGIGWVTQPTLQFFINSTFIRVFGRTFWAMRLPWALTGALIVGLTFLLVRAAFGRRTAVIAGLLIMGADTAIHFSRIGLNNIADALFMLWVLAAGWVAGATGNPKAYAAAGIGLGLGQYYYFGARAIPFVVLATLLVWLIADRRGTLHAWKLILGAGIVTLVVAGPLFGNWVLHPGSLTEHLELTLPFTTHLQRESAGMGVSQWVDLWRRVRDSLLVFTVTPDRGSFYHPGQPMLHPLQAPIFLIGLVALIANRRKPFMWGLLAWILVDLALGSVLITDAATFHRLLGVLPAGVIVVALGVDAGTKVLTRAARGSALAGAILAGVVTVVLVGVDVGYYFGDYIQHVDYKPPVQQAVTLAALDWEHLQGRGTFVLYTNEGVDVAANKIYHTPISYISLDTFVAGSPEQEGKLDRSKPVYFYVLSDRADQIARIETAFPGGAIKEYHRPSDNMVILTRYTLAPN